MATVMAFEQAQADSQLSQVQRPATVAIIEHSVKLSIHDILILITQACKRCMAYALSLLLQVVLGPAVDGGYYLLGTTNAAMQMFEVWHSVHTLT